jgi:hypothetical protein
MIASYRNKYGLIDQVGGASAAGFLYKFKEGPKPAVAGAAIGKFSILERLTFDH